jgi:membrane protease YdiL (CAAX protease family)
MIQNRFLQNALSGVNKPQYYLATLLIVFGCFLFVGQLPLLAGAVLHALFSGPEVMETLMSGKISPTDLGMNKTLFLSLYILTFAISLFALFLLLRFYHKRSWKSLIISRENFNFSKILFASGLYLLVLIGGELYMYFQMPEAYSISFHPAGFFPLLLACLLLLPFQTSFEEIFFRGYLLQGLSIGVKNAWLPLILTSVIFGLLHSWNPEVEKHGFWLMFPYYVGFGLILGTIALLDESLEIPLAVHFVNNFYGATIVTFPESAMQTDAIITMSHMNPVGMILPWALGMLIFTIIIIQKYNLNDFSKLIR